MAYIRNVARQIMAQLGITTADLGEEDFAGIAQVVYERRSGEIKAWLSRVRPETLGRIAACGQGYPSTRKGTPLYLVHCGTWLGKRDSGPELLREIACTAIIAEISDILEDRKELEETAVPCRRP